MKKNVTYYSFQPGVDLIPHGLIPQFREEMLVALGGVSLTTFYQKMKGTTNLGYDQKIAIDKVFERYNIPVEKAWKVWQEES